MEFVCPRFANHRHLDWPSKLGRRICELNAHFRGSLYTWLDGTAAYSTLKGHRGNSIDGWLCVNAPRSIGREEWNTADTDVVCLVPPQALVAFLARDHGQLRQLFRRG